MDIDLYEAVSALQKEIRRGHEREALYWAMRLIPRDEKYLWIRILTVAHEDVGVANPTVLTVIPACERAFFYFRAMNKNGSARLALTNAVVLLARSPKCRLSDHLQCIVSDDIARGVKLAIPPYAIDRHTRRGRKQGKGMEQWLKEGCVLEPAPDAAFTLYQQEAEERWLRGVAKLNWSGKRENESGDLFADKGESNDNEESSD